ncbi:hypothetical protein BCV69DRAFT_128225 [Microstroma glucosiphilum]|uniref:Uncharacterized protein n=1 Tax=Pseudomicrostroma glucosiphilum TaxID=1684307 RepID=A0A316TYD3_9BASI|nr:hypothetical protein BCV69DRAFT_128225 [Pseudomicrostroma glucosiphilum]PWN17734.1 hypothetical protein BCV69DRAFT_128225 [Pseudomicrostroma glucosiphilum]
MTSPAQHIDVKPEIGTQTEHSLPSDATPKIDGETSQARRQEKAALRELKRLRKQNKVWRKENKALKDELAAQKAEVVYYSGEVDHYRGLHTDARLKLRLMAYYKTEAARKSTMLRDIKKFIYKTLDVSEVDLQVAESMSDDDSICNY